MEKVISIVIVAVFATAIWAVVMGGMWGLWCWVVPQIYASGPQGFIRPTFWLFVGCWTLVVLIGRSIFGQRSE